MEFSFVVFETVVLTDIWRLIEFWTYRQISCIHTRTMNGYHGKTNVANFTLFETLNRYT